MDDMQIIDLFWQREETAISEVDKKYNHYCFQIAWNILSDREDSEECVNDTWFSAWKCIPPTRPNKLSLLLGKITRGLAIDCLRKKYAAKRVDRHMQDIAGELENLDRAVADTTQDAIEKQELIRTINDFLYRLPEVDRDIFIRRYWYADSIKDIMKRHRLSASSVKSKLFRSRKKLQQEINSEAVGGGR